MKTRLLSIASYLGLAPELWLFTSKEKQDLLLRHHIQQSLSLALLGLFCFLLIPVVQVLEYKIGLAFPSTDPNPYRAADILSLLPSLVWWLLLGVGLWRAAVGSPSPVPVAAGLSANRVTRLLSIVWGFLFQLICILLLLLPLRMNSITRPQNRPASVYMLYQQVQFEPLPYTHLGTFTVPRWIFALGFYPISEVATARWGEGSVAVEPLTRENLNEAFQYGHLVMIASHGGYYAGTLPLSWDPEDYYSPADITPGGVGDNLQLVYMAGCYVGALGTTWENALSPARVITFNRISWESEHVFWLWFVGPGLASELK